MNLKCTTTFEKNYLVYAHLKKDTGEVFYIGKGKIKRMNTTTQRSKMWHSIVDKHGYDILVIEDNLSEEESFEREKYWINRIGRRDKNLGTLINFTDGGDGITGYHHSEETKEKIRLGHLGKSKSESHKKNISKSKQGANNSSYGKFGEESRRFGKKHSEETKRKISETKRLKNAN